MKPEKEHGMWELMYVANKKMSCVTGVRQQYTGHWKELLYLSEFEETHANEKNQAVPSGNGVSVDEAVPTHFRSVEIRFLGSFIFYAFLMVLPGPQTNVWQLVVKTEVGLHPLIFFCLECGAWLADAILLPLINYQEISRNVKILCKYYSGIMAKILLKTPQNWFGFGLFVCLFTALL